MILTASSVNQRVILSRLVVETASNSFHLSMSPSSVLARGFWSDLYGYDLRSYYQLNSIILYKELSYWAGELF